MHRALNQARTDFLWTLRHQGLKRGIDVSYIDVGTVDLFRDEDIAFATRLMQAGVPTELHVNPGLTTQRKCSRRTLRYRLWARRIEALRRGLA